MKVFGTICAYLFSFSIGIILGGLLVMKFWEWFINPVFNLGLLSLTQAIGLSVFITLFKTVSFGKKEKADLGSLIALSITYQVILLGFGWIISLFI